MGEVYLARDTRLDRDVAIKVLPNDFTSDADRLARFEREARLLASLNHPNIAAIYGFEESAGTRALILEYIEGSTLADRIATERMPVDDVIAIATQVCQALDAAHERGIVHRDLKPTNIKVRSDGVVKVLDFGLAKVLDPPATSERTHSPTITSPAITRMGVILGTAAYMSPEQAKGRVTDKRSDIFAFGCVLYEMLTGKRAFEGEDVSETIAAILRGEPDWSALDERVPQRLRWLLRRCVEKERRRRMADIDDVRIELEDCLNEIGTPAVDEKQPSATRYPNRRRQAGVVVLALVAGALSTWAFLPHTALAPPSIQRVAVAVEAGYDLASAAPAVLAVSPDGRRIVYAATSGNRSSLLLRVLDRYSATVVAGSDGASVPFFSPDGEWIGFFAPGALRKVAVHGGATPLKICDVASVVAASWSGNGDIVFATAVKGDGLWRVSSGGGAPERITTPQSSTGEVQHTHPQILTDGKRVLFTVVRADTSQPAILDGNWLLAGPAPDSFRRWWRAIHTDGSS